MSRVSVLIFLACSVVLVVFALVACWRVTVTWIRARHQVLAEGELADLFIFIPAAQLSLVLSLSAATLLAALHWAGVPWLVALSICGLWVLGPRWLLAWLRRRRQSRLVVQLPDALSLLAGLLRAGHGLGQGLALLALRQPAPLGQELQLIVRRQRLGVPMDAALQDLAARVPEPDVALVVLAVRVSRDIGGNLAESLQRLGEGIRARVLMRERIDALTSQGKLQGWIIGLLPLFMMLALSMVDPGPMGWLFHTGAGWSTLLVIAALEFSGFLLIRRIVRIEL